MTRKKLILIDGHALVHRAFHALPPLTSPKGVVTNAVYGFGAVLLKILKDFRPEYVAATFDLAAPTFRHEEFADYKAHREKAPDELHAQVPLVKIMLQGFGIPIYEKEGFEADDMIGSLAVTASKEKNLQVIIVTGDLDTLQLVSGDDIVVCTLKKGVSDTVVYDEKEVHKRYGLAPEQLVDFKGLKGDPSDNIPGVPGIGEKTASALLQEFGTLEKLYEAAEGSGAHKVLTVKLREKLKENKDMAFFSKHLATIIRDVPSTFSLKEASWKDHFQRETLESFFKEFGISSLAKRLPEALGEVQPEQGTLFSEQGAQPEAVVGNVPVIKDSDISVGYDLKPLVKKDGVAGNLFDIKIAAWLLAPDARDYDFGRIYSSFLARPAPAQPSADDVLRLKGVLWDELKGRDLIRVFEDIEMPLIPVLAAMELRGIAIDVPALSKLLKKTSDTLEKLEKKIFEYAGEEFNINSPAQLGGILFEKLSLKGKVRKTGGGARSTAAPELEKLREEHPIIDLILEYRELQKLKTTYIEPFPQLIGVDKRLHTTYNQTGAATGRMSSQDPNLQNIPTRTEIGQQFRQAFVAEKGYRLLSFDYTQLELRIVAHLAQDEIMIKVFRHNEDIHTRTASEIFKVAPERVTKDMRRTAKVLNFGIIYGMGVLGFARASGVGREEARAFIDAYFKEFKGVAQYMEDTKRLAAKQGYVSTLFGRRRPLPDITSTLPQLRAQAERMAINHPVQGTEADLMKMTMIAVHEALTKRGWNNQVRMLLQVHDELVFEVRENMVAEAAVLIKEIMEKIHTLDVPLTVDAKVGPNWSDMEELAP